MRLDESKSRSLALPRRRFCVAAGIALFAPQWLLSRRAGAANAGLRMLAFEHTHTGERIAIGYKAGDSYLPQALQSLSHFLRDFRNGENHPIDPLLFDRLHTLAAITGTRAPFQVISGYRSPETNSALRKKSGGVASHSLHLEGRAIDVRLADVPLSGLRDVALSLKAGGVGYYPGSDFVHLDTGAVRRW